MSTLRNRVQLIGNFGTDPQVKNLESGKKVASFSIATNESYKNEKGEWQQSTEWHNVVAWEKSATYVEKFCKKGSLVAVDGKLHSRSYVDKDGVKRYATEIVLSEIQVLEKKD